LSKWCCVAVVLAVVCLLEILLSLEADAQPTIDESITCSASTLDMVKIMASNQQDNAQVTKDEIRGVKT